MLFLSKKQKMIIDSTFRTYENAIRDLEEDVRRLRNNYLSIDGAKKRDYLVRTDYIGRITDTGLLEDYKKEIEQQFEKYFDACCCDVLNFNCTDLTRFREILNLYEMKQIILDTYAKKAPKVKQQ